MSLQLNSMMSKMRFTKGHTDIPRAEVWHRRDYTIYRYTPYDGKRTIEICTKDMDGVITRKDMYDVNDPRAAAAIKALALPFNIGVGPVGHDSLEDDTRHNANHFDSWVRLITNDPNRDIRRDHIRFRFGDCYEFLIPMYSVDFLDATQKYLDTLNVIARENHW